MNIPVTLGAADPVGHVINHVAVKSEDGVWLWSAIQTNMIISALILIIVGIVVAKSVNTGGESEGHKRWITNNPFAHMIEVICSYLRETTIRPLLGSRTERFTPFLWTLFFFILVNNILGLIPLLDAWHLANPADRAAHKAWIGGTATQSIWVTAALAIVAGVMINLAGIKELGVGGYLKHLTAEAPIFVWPIMIPIEVLGTFIKPIALAIRLFANMTAGHILVAVLLGFASNDGFFADNLAIGLPVGVASTIAVIAIYFLELFVAFLQAFVFMFLTTVFISLLEHHHDHEHETAHELAEAGLA